MFKIIRGDMGEGGGSILRFAFALSVLTKEPIKITSIRAKRKNPGLRTQHLIAIKTIQEIFGGELSPVEVGTQELTFKPEVNIKKNEFKLHIKTAGSIALVIQAIRLALANHTERMNFTITGGATYGMGAPSIDYMINVTEQTLKHFGYESKFSVNRHGFYPKGGAHVQIELWKKENSSSPDEKFFLNSSPLTKIHGISVASSLLEKAHVADRQKKSALKILQAKFPSAEIEIEPKYVDAICPGSGLTLWTEHEGSYVPLGWSEIGKKGVSSEKIGKQAAYGLIKNYETGAAVDEFLTDQLIPYVALNAPFSFSTPLISSHTRTNMQLVEEFLPVRFSYRSDNSRTIISVDKSN